MISTIQRTQLFSKTSIIIRYCTIGRVVFLSILLGLLIGTNNLNAQSGYPIRIINAETNEIYKNIILPSFDSLAIAQTIQRVVISLWAKGYAEAGIDSATIDSTQAKFSLHKGTRFKTAKFKIVAPSKVLQNLPFYIKVHNVGLLSLTSATDALLNSTENQGYPFATFTLDSVAVDGNKITGLLRLIPGTFVVFDTLIIKGQFRANRSYLNYLLGIKKDEVYRERLVKQVSSTITRLGYLAEQRPAEPEFIPRKARIYIYLRQRKANQVSALIGLAGKENGGMTFKGDADLKLINTLNLSEKIELHWRKLEANEQKFDASVTFPWLGIGGLGSSAGIAIYRRDTTLLVVNPTLALNWSIPGGHTIQAFVNIRKVATNGRITLPGYGTSNATLYGLGYNFEKTKGTLFPIAEMKMATKVSVGSRSADYPTENQTVLSRKSTAFGLNFHASLYRSLVGPFGLYAGYTGAAIGAFGGNGYNQLFYNELLQVGGYGSLRGFNEEFFWISSYHVGTAEARFYFESESFAFLFVDKGYLERNYIGGFQTFSPTGIGVGTQLEMGNGLFRLAYALGSTNGATPKFKEAKIHFGFTARF
ncbi:BamA/TamA family outer membrane protein [Williamwhitmania taraxaci]|uniref:Outer membrane protein assembly factor BamA n=1 Tax=Williamwhitmania taraxaci TaxID=1640674 RepID=A0A1G6GIP7_9BACT|nr:hypothetical protein [Williamwhitmania taraxaci]SDB81703.1 Outer membrane protein assembly factor BamA [Williamwhitmania taraxaci]